MRSQQQVRQWAGEVKAAQEAVEAARRAREAEAARQAVVAREASQNDRAQVTAQAGAQVAGSCGDWLAAAGVDDVASALTLIRRESGCNPNAVNSSSGACGVAQELPCGKSGCVLGDGACQVRWMQTYVSGRYGSWANALGHSYAYGWY